MFSNMKPAEKRLLDACQRGEFLFLGEKLPIEKTVDNEIRGEFLRALILSNNQEIEEDGEKYILKIDSKGIKFSGVYISGTFDFSFQETNLPFSFGNSNFENNINLSDSRIRFLSLSGSKILSLTAYRLVCRSDIILRNIESLEKVDFVSAQINGDLICKNGKFRNEDGISLHCNKIKIERSVFLDDGFESNGEVNFVSAQIGSILSCKNGKFINENKKALNCNSVKVGNAVFLFDSFKALGNVHFSYSQIENRLVLSKLEIEGNFYLTSAKINTIFIDKLDEIEISENIYLDGLQYEHLDVKNLNDKKLVSLLSKMPIEETFKPQPYKQLAKVLRNMGHNEDADDIMIEYNDIITSKNDNKFIKLLKLIYGFTAGYGYKPMRVLWTMFTVWLFCSLFYWNASKVAVFAPSNPLVFQKKDCYQCNVNSDGTPWSDIFSWEKYNSSNNWIDSKLEGEYTTFNPFWYSLDVILPIVDLQVEKDWAQYIPSNDWTLNDFTRWLMWFEILFGWIYSLILVAILSGLAKNEKD